MNIVLAMIISTTKAGIVAWWFMHLKYDSMVNRWIFLGTLGFILLLWLFSASDLLAKSMAKSLAIKTGQTLNEEEQEHIVNSLFACKEPLVSPTNKTTFITLSVDDIEKKFM